MTTNERFLARVNKAGTCWLWTGEKKTSGYGYLETTRDGKRTRRFAHRLSYELNVGTIPAGYYVCHRCDTPLCVRPDHLFAGTAADNQHDKIAKGRSRHVRGEEVVTARLSGEQVRQIRHRTLAGEPARVVAAAHGIGMTTVYRIRHRESWRHVE